MQRRTKVSPNHEVVSVHCERLAEGLEPCRKLPGVRDVRVLGAIGVVQLEQAPLGAELDALRRRFVEEGVWVRPFGDVVYLMPPFIVSDAELETLVSAVRKVIAELSTAA